jgi:hypothetical protein
MAPAGGAVNPDSAIATQAVLTKLDRIMVFLRFAPAPKHEIVDGGL